jgi:hypothetical protein
VRRLFLALFLSGALVGCARGPEERHWRRLGPGPARVELRASWGRPLPFCPASLGAGERHVILVAGEQRLALDPRTGEPVPDLAEEPAPAADRGARLFWEDRTLTLYGPAGRLVASREGRLRPAWVVEFGTAVEAPLQLHRGRVVVQALDNYVYALRARNGHELWRTRLSHRLTRAGAFWEDQFLSIPANAGRLVVLDLRDGSESGSWSLEDPAERFVSGPVVVGDRVVAAASPWGAGSCSALGLDILPETVD